MGLLNDIQSKLSSNKQGLNGLGDLLAPAALGGIVGLLLTSGKVRRLAGSALLVGGGAVLGNMLWTKYKNRLATPENTGPYPVTTSLPPAEAHAQAVRLIRALVFAAKSDGHIDDAEAKNIRDNIAQMNLDADTEAIIQEAMNQPLDPMQVADGVKSMDEALQLYILSCSVIDIDHFMEHSYLKALAQALGIPEDMRMDIETELKNNNGSQ